jgi:NitT/TauT family transport system substrate-binding protein
LGLLLAAIALGCAGVGAAHAQTLRIGHFPNVTHVQALVAHHLSRIGKGWFEQRLGPDAKIDWYVYNAGPSAMEAVFAGAIDLTYVGPSPALNAYARSKGEEIRIVAGAATGGAALVVQPDSTLTAPADFRGKKIATPQLGNTQDVSARAWLARGGLRITLTGGDAQVIPTDNPDQLALFKRRELDAVWTVEPWVTRLEQDAGGKVLVEEHDAITTVLVSSVKFLATQPELLGRFVAAHRELTAWILANSDVAQAMAREELAAETHGQIAAATVAHAWARIGLSAEISRDQLDQFVANAQKAGFLRNAPDLARLVVQP